MIIYQSTKTKFTFDVVTNNIENVILELFQKKFNRTTTKSEINAWKNSMMYMENILQDKEIPEDCGVMIEYQIPQTSKRVDFIITGQNDVRTDHAIIIELKQWEKAQVTEKDGIISTYLGQSVRETNHPSYQAWSYAALLNSYNEAVYNEDVQLKPCAYLHNYSVDDDGVTNDFYSEYIKKAPLFLRSDALKLREFIKKFVKYGDKGKVMYQIESGKIRPSKSLADSLQKMLDGNQEFIMIDDQKLVYETALDLARKSTSQNKNVLIVRGGPGTGKSVVAINLLVELTKHGVAQYITKNAAPRAVYQSKLTGSRTLTEISNLFTGSGSFVDSEKNIFDSLIVDEAHRLNEKSGMYKNKGENQIKEIIEASKFSVFFVDEDQKVTWHDIGEAEEIKKWADKLGANVTETELTSQFRCNGSDGYLAWLDNTLQIRDTVNKTLNDIDFDFKIVGSPAVLRDMIFEKNIINNKARLVAGYCWDWISKNNKKLKDITIPEFDFSMRWNLASDGNLWILAPESVNEVGCIHTCQGLEVDYIGVIIGDDLIVRDGKVLVDPSKRAKTDSSLKGYKKFLKENPEVAKEKMRAIIKNTYRTLMTRGMKGCYVYFTDKETEKYFKSRL